MALSWERYVTSQELPEQCPVCGGDWYDEHADRPMVPAGVEPFCSESCRQKYLDEQRRDADGLAADFAWEKEHADEIAQAIRDR